MAAESDGYRRSDILNDALSEFGRKRFDSGKNIVVSETTSVSQVACSKCMCEPQVYVENVYFAIPLNCTYTVAWLCLDLQRASALYYVMAHDDPRTIYYSHPSFHHKFTLINLRYVR